MITKNQLKTAQVLCKGIAKYRAGGRCEMQCRREATEGHHVFFGNRWRAYWQLLVNENFYLGLCVLHHKTGSKFITPHGEEYHWWEMMREEINKTQFKGFCTIPPDRVAVLLAQKDRLYKQDFLPDRDCDGSRELARLKMEFEKWKAIYEMDQDACQVDPRLVERRAG